jgi:hypothetical protein
LLFLIFVSKRLRIYSPVINCQYYGCDISFTTKNKIDASGYADINLVRARADIPAVDQTVYNNQTTLRALLRNERIVEFAFEGLRFFDIQRWEIGSQAMSGTVNGVKIGTVDPGTGK